MNNPLVSVIIPNYNHAKYLDERIRSVLNQTYRNFEVIILDDCSPDDGESKAIIERYRNNPHISHIEYNEVNSGSPFKQWHKGLELAKGNLIWIAESDDTCSPFFLESLVIVHIKTDAVLTFCRSILVDENGKMIRDSWKMFAVDENLILDGRQFLMQFLCYSNVILNASSVIFNKTEALQLDDDYMDYKGVGDWLFWIKMSLKGKVCFVNKELNNFRQHKNTTNTLIRNGVEFYEVKKIYDWLQRENLITEDIFSKCRENNIFIILSIDSISPKVKAELYAMWDASNWERCKMFFIRKCRNLCYRIKQRFK